MIKACVIGWPVAHSRSPLIQTYWLRHYGIDGSYGKEAVPPEEIAGFFGSLKARGYVGANVTLPHKEAALEAAAEADEAARAIGAANTLWFDDEGRLIAGNSDAYGFISNLDAGVPGWREKTDCVLVLGAGGASRAVIYGLIEAGVGRVLVANRSQDRAEALKRDFGAAVVVVPWADKEQAMAACGLLVNATSLGMEGKPPLELDLSALPREAVVTDLVYAPLETALLAEARARGNRIVDGLGMLLHQAVPGFQRWFGTRPEVTPELRALVVADLAGEAA